MQSTSVSHRSANELLSRLFDYAGLYPPAGLSVEDAVSEYVRLLGSSESHLVGPFVVDAARLADVGQQYGDALPGETLYASLLVGGRNSVEHDVGVAVAALGDGSNVTIEQVETQWPTGNSGAEGAIAFVREHIMQLQPRYLFMEVDPRTADLAEVVRAVTDANAGRGTEKTADVDQAVDQAVDHTVDRAVVHATVLDAGPNRSATVALKIRCGGATPADVPPVPAVAQFLLACRAGNVSFKATAGLHHPVRRWHGDFGGYMHGFLNVFLAAAILYARESVDIAELEAILLDEDPTNFRFSSGEAAWKDRTVDVDELATARAQFALSIGSCSVVEPVDDLADLGLWQPDVTNSLR